MLDQELIDDLSKQIEEQSVIIKKAIEVLDDDLTQSEAFINCGQVVDRIYGAISMFGFPELSEYCLKMKEACYKCSNTDPEHEVARSKCLKMIKSYFSNSEMMTSVLAGGDNASEVTRNISLETKKIDKILASYLHSVSGSSVAYDDTRTYIYVYDKLGTIESNYKSLNKEIFPSPKFFNAYAGFTKAAEKNSKEISGFILDIESDSWELALKEIREKNPLISIFITSKNKRTLQSIDKVGLKVQGVFSSTQKYNKFVTAFEKVEQQAKAQQLLSSSNKESDKDNESREYTKIAVDVFKSGLPSPFDVYLKLNDKKYLKVTRKGEGFDPEQVKKHEEKNVHQYYIEKNDFDQYFSSLDEEIKRIQSDPNISVKKKQKVALDYADNVLYFMETKGVDEESLSAAKDFVEMSEKIVTEVAQGSDLVKDFLSDLANMERGSSLAMLSGLFLNKMNASKEIHNDIALGCFLHDIGLLGMPEHIKDGNLEEMNDEERGAFIAHPKKGAQKLAEAGIKPALIEAVNQHHMRLDNSGFPRVTKGQKINPIAELIGLCDDFSIVLKKYEGTDEDPIAMFKEQMKGRFSKKLYDVFSLTFPA
jgi:HD-GYP domain-containing protein (c-di-GMP phosphodiesterase class II)